eukprot:TRINITY_DN11028_c0_g2_i9.p1 TRINITY_DN11028_c0_g2~~TRINITY_DN11028_c0_g2_i9.p1  ORF type:complete len:241 (-),score=66.18 TRINITY_DN11028_c0_g2_i9:330-1052(-)
MYLLQKIKKFFNRIDSEDTSDSLILITKKRVYVHTDVRNIYFLPFLEYSTEDFSAEIYLNHRSPCYATELLNKYCEFDPRFPAINTFILHWAKMRRLLDPYNGLSSYALTLLVIFFLEILEAPVLTSIQKYAIASELPVKKREIPSFHGLLKKKLKENETKKFKEVFTNSIDVSFRDVDVERMRKELEHPKNEMSAAELITLFYYYFGFEYNVCLLGDIIEDTKRETNDEKDQYKGGKVL